MKSSRPSTFCGMRDGVDESFAAEVELPAEAAEIGDTEAMVLGVSAETVRVSCYHGSDTGQPGGNRRGARQTASGEKRRRRQLLGFARGVAFTLLGRGVARETIECGLFRGREYSGGDAQLAAATGRVGRDHLPLLRQRRSKGGGIRLKSGVHFAGMNLDADGELRVAHRELHAHRP